MIRSLSVVALTAIPGSLRSSIASESQLVALARRVARRILLAMRAARRLVHVHNDDVARAALSRDGFSIDQGRFRDGAPRNLDHARYDILRQVR
jgi:hypothetical protein